MDLSRRFPVKVKKDFQLLLRRNVTEYALEHISIAVKSRAVSTISLQISEVQYVV